MGTHVKLSNALLVFLVANFIALNSFAQEKIPQVTIYGDVKNQITDKEIAGVTVQLISNGQLIETKTSSTGGKFKFKSVGIFQDYKVVFTGKNLVSRFVEFELKNIPADKTYGEWDFELPMKMVEKNKYVDLTVLESRRSSVIKFNKSSGELDFNNTEIVGYRNELDRLLKQASQKEITENRDKSKYDSLMAAGNSGLTAGNFDTAIYAYTKALEIKQNDKTAGAQLERAQAIKKENSEANRKLYNSLISVADKLFGEKNYTDAKEYYQRAKTNFKYNEPYPVQQITACEMKLDSNKVMTEPIKPTENTVVQENRPGTKASILHTMSNDSYEKAKRFIAVEENNRNFYAGKNDKDARDSYNKQRQLNENSFSMLASSQNQDELRLRKINAIEEQKTLQMRNVDTATLAKPANSLSNNVNGLEYGVHEWKTQRLNSKKEVVEVITERLVVGEHKADKYMMTRNKWGVAFSKNGQTIGEHTWNKETNFGAIILHE